MKVRIKENLPTKDLFNFGWVVKDEVYDVIGINSDEYSMEHIAIKDSFGDRLVVFHDEYEVVE